jgi:hypothetical protein
MRVRRFPVSGIESTGGHFSGIARCGFLRAEEAFGITCVTRVDVPFLRGAANRLDPYLQAIRSRSERQDVHGIVEPATALNPVNPCLISGN